jgi:hypothetical protein
MVHTLLQAKSDKIPMEKQVMSFTGVDQNTICESGEHVLFQSTSHSSSSVVQMVISGNKRTRVGTDHFVDESDDRIEDSHYISLSCKTIGELKIYAANHNIRIPSKLTTKKAITKHIYDLTRNVKDNT